MDRSGIIFKSKKKYDIPKIRGFYVIPFNEIIKFISPRLSPNFFEIAEDETIAYIRPVSDNIIKSLAMNMILQVLGFRSQEKLYHTLRKSRKVINALTKIVPKNLLILNIYAMAQYRLITELGDFIMPIELASGNIEGIIDEIGLPLTKEKIENKIRETEIYEGLFFNDIFFYNKTIVDVASQGLNLFMEGELGKKLTVEFIFESDTENRDEVQGVYCNVKYEEVKNDYVAVLEIVKEVEEQSLPEELFRLFEKTIDQLNDVEDAVGKLYPIVTHINTKSDYDERKRIQEYLRDLGFDIKSPLIYVIQPAKLIMYVSSIDGKVLIHKIPDEDYEKLFGEHTIATEFIIPKKFVLIY